MSFLTASTATMTAAGAGLAGIESALRQANQAAAAATTGVLPAAADEVSTAIATLFGGHGLSYQSLSARAAAFQQEFAQLLNASADAYATAESANAAQTLLDVVNAPTQALL